MSSPDNYHIQHCQAECYSAGENIMIQGLPNGWGWLEYLFRHFAISTGQMVVLP